MLDKDAIDMVARALATTAGYASSKSERLAAVRALAHYVHYSRHAADCLSTIYGYSNDEDLKQAAFDAMNQEVSNPRAPLEEEDDNDDYDDD